MARPTRSGSAGLIYEEVVRALSQYKVAWVADTDAGAKYRPGPERRLLRHAAPARPGDQRAGRAGLHLQPGRGRLLARPEVRQVEGEAVARGILRYLNSDDPGSGFVEPYPRRTPPGGGGGPPCRDPALT